MYLSPSKYERLTKRKASLEASLIKAEAALDAVLGAEGVKSYKFASGSGSQAATRASASDIHSMIMGLENALDYVIQELNGGGVVNINVRRIP